MKIKLGLVSCLVSLFLFSASAGAYGTADGRMTVVPKSTTAVVAQRPAPGGTRGTVAEIYGNFSSDLSNLYNCCNGWTISAQGSIASGPYYVAAPFTPSQNYVATTITVAVGWLAGTNGVIVSLRDDAGGLPGAVIRQIPVMDLPSFGSCCVTTSVALGKIGAPVIAGKQYWVVVEADAVTNDTWAAWSFNSVGTYGLVAFNSGSGWNVYSNNVPAFSVSGLRR